MRSRWNDMLVYLIAVSLALLLAFSAYSQDVVQQEEDKISYKKKTTIDFADKTIEGELVKPDGAFVGVRKDIKFKNFIKVRANFRDKLAESSDNI